MNEKIAPETPELKKAVMENIIATFGRPYAVEIFGEKYIENVLNLRPVAASIVSPPLSLPESSGNGVQMPRASGLKGAISSPPGKVPARDRAPYSSSRPKAGSPESVYEKMYEDQPDIEPLGYSIGTGKWEWGKTLDSGEITIEQYLKRIDPAGQIWKDDGSLPLFDFSQDKIIEHIKKLKTFKRANDYLNRLGIVFDFILDKNGDSIPRRINFTVLAGIIKMNTAQKLQSAFRSLREHDMDEMQPLTYWQHVLGLRERQLREWCMVGLKVDGQVKDKNEKILIKLKADKTRKPYRTCRRWIDDFFEKTGRKDFDE